MSSNDDKQRFWPSRRYVAVIQRNNEHGVPIREEVAQFRDRADAALFVKAYNIEHAGTTYYRADLRELRYADA